jgi:hypothetical protein
VRLVRRHHRREQRARVSLAKSDPPGPFSKFSASFSYPDELTSFPLSSEFGGVASQMLTVAMR